MAGVLKHGFASTKPNTSDPTKVGSTKWNAEHAFAGGNLGALLFRDTGESDGANWLNSVASGQVLVSGGVGAAPAWSATPTLTSIQLGNTGLKVTDTGGSHVLSFVPGSSLTANRTLTFVTGDASRTVTYSGNPTLDDWFNQSVKTSASPTFSSVVLGGIPSHTGALCMSAGTAINIRNFGNSLDLALLSLSGGDVVAIGDGNNNGASINSGGGVVAISQGKLVLGGTAASTNPYLKKVSQFVALRLGDDSGVSGAAAASLPAGASGNDGIIGFDTTNHRFVYYEGGNRYYLAGTSF